MEKKINSVIAPNSDNVISKEELRPLFETLISSHLTNSSHPSLSFDAWYAQLDNWGRRVIHASQLKQWLINYDCTDWSEISRLIPGVHLEMVTESIKLSQVINRDLGGSPTSPDA